MICILIPDYYDDFNLLSRIPLDTRPILTRLIPSFMHSALLKPNKQFTNGPRLGERRHDDIYRTATSSYVFAYFSQPY